MATDTADTLLQNMLNQQAPQRKESADTLLQNMIAGVRTDIPSTPETRSLSQAEIDQKFARLSGTLPSPEPPQKQRRLRVKGVPQDSLVSHREAVRKQAFDELIADGHSVEDITSALAFQEATKPPSRAFQIAGTVAAGVAAGQAIPGPFDEALGLGVGARRLLTARKLTRGQRAIRGAARAGIEGLGGVGGHAVDVAIDPDRDFTLKNAAGVFAEETTLSGATELLSPVGRVIIGGSRRTLIPGAEALSEGLAKKGRELGIKNVDLVASQATDNRIVRHFESFAEGGILDPGLVQSRVGRQAKVAGEQIKDAVNEIAPLTRRMSERDLSIFVKDVVESRGNAQALYVGRKFDEAKSVIGEGKIVDLGPSGVGAAKIIDETEQALDIGITPASSHISTGLERGPDFVPTRVSENRFSMNVGRRRVFGAPEEMLARREVDLAGRVKRGVITTDQATEELQRFTRSMIDLPVGEEAARLVDWDTGADMLSRIKRALRVAEAPLTANPQAVGELKRVQTILQNSMNKAAREHGGLEGLRKWENARRLYAAKENLFGAEWIKKLVKELPNKPGASKAIFESEQNIRQARKMMGPGNFQVVKRAWLESVTRDAALANATKSKVSGELADPLGRHILNTLDAMDPNALKQAYSAKELKTIRDAALTMDLVQGSPDAGVTLKYLQGVAIAGAATSLLTDFGETRAGGVIDPLSKGVLIGPAVLSLLLTRKSFNDILKAGLQAPKGSRLAVNLQARLFKNILQARRDVARNRREATEDKPLKTKRVDPRQLRGFGGRGF